VVVCATIATDPPPVMAPSAEEETEEEEAAQREAHHEQRMAEYRAEQERKEEERKAEFELQQKEYEAEQGRRDKQRRARVAIFDRILEQAPALFAAAQLRLFLRFVVYADPIASLRKWPATSRGTKRTWNRPSRISQWVRALPTSPPRTF